MTRSIDLILAAFDQTGPAYESAIDNANRYAGAVQAASAQASSTSSVGFGTMAVGAALAAAKFALIGGAIAGAGYLVWKNWDTIKAATGTAVEWIGEQVSSFADWLSSDFASGLTSFLNGAWEGIKKIGENVTTVLRGIVNALIAGNFGLAADIAIGAVHLAFLKGKDAILSTWDSMGAKIVEFMQEHMQGVLQLWNQVVGAIAEQAVVLYIDDEDARKKFLWYEDAIKKQQEQLKVANAAGEKDAAARIERNIALNRKLQSEVAPGAQKAQAQAMVREETARIAEAIKNKTYDDELRNKAKLDQEARQKQIDALKEQLKANIKKAQDEAGPGAIDNFIKNWKEKAFSAGQGLWDAMFGDKKSPASPSNQLAQLQNERFISGAGASSRESLQAQMIRKQDEGNGLLKVLADWTKRQMGTTTTAAVKAGVEAAKTGGVKF